MPATPLYTAQHLNPAYKLRFSWCGFPLRGTSFPSAAPDGILAALAPLWDDDGLRLLEHRWQSDRIQMTFSTSPGVTPVLIASRTKGRLQHALRQQGQAVSFARNFSIHSLGDNTVETVERYVREQVQRADLADPKYIANLQQCAWDDPSVSLSEPVETGSGRYLYNLHLVLVTAERYRIGASTTGMTLKDVCLAVARKHGFAIANLAVMPDHLHMAFRGNPEKSPEEMALSVQNNTAWALGRNRIWEPTYYVGTFGEYTMRAVRG